MVQVLSDMGSSAADLMLSAALSAIRRQDDDRAIALARKVFAEKSTGYSDHLFLGQFYMAAHRPREAGEAFRRAVELGPGVPVTWVSYVRYLVLEAEIDQAKAAVAAASKALPPDRANLALAQCEAMLGKTSEAEARVQAALKSADCDLTVIRVAVDFYINQGRFDQVEPILDRLRYRRHGKTPGCPRLGQPGTLSLARMSTGRPADADRALALVELNLKTNPASVLGSTDSKAVLLAFKTGRRGDAITLLEPLDQSGQLSTNEQFILAQAYLSERHVSRYQSLIKKLLASVPKYPRHLAHFVEFLLDSGDLGQAEKWVAELRTLSARSAGLLELEARLLDAQDRKPELRALLLERGRQFPDELVSVARLLERFGFAGEAEASCKAFIASNSNEPEQALVLASFLARQDRIKEATALLETAWKTCRPKRSQWPPWHSMSHRPPMTTSNIGSRHGLARPCRKAPLLRAALGPMLAAIYCRHGRYDKAEALFRQILDRDPENVETLNNLAWELALREPGAAREALELVDRAIEKGAWSPPSSIPGPSP